MKQKLLNNKELEWSDVAANCRMNREREITGTNSYTADLKMNPLDFLMSRDDAAGKPVRWLDLCCGSGRALIQARDYFQKQNLQRPITILGVDLVDYFMPFEATDESLRLETASLHSWKTRQKFDLITCVHGLHYVGDKLKLISDVANWLKPDGLFIAHLDLDNLQSTDGAWKNSEKREFLKLQNLELNPRTHLLSCKGRQQVRFPCQYLGASDQAGPNYTGQPAVNSVYELISE